MSAWTFAFILVCTGYAVTAWLTYRGYRQEANIKAAVQANEMLPPHRDGPKLYPGRYAEDGTSPYPYRDERYLCETQPIADAEARAWLRGRLLRLALGMLAFAAVTGASCRALAVLLEGV